MHSPYVSIYLCSYVMLASAEANHKRRFPMLTSRHRYAASSQLTFCPQRLQPVGGWMVRCGGYVIHVYR